MPRPSASVTPGARNLRGASRKEIARTIPSHAQATAPTTAFASFPPSTADGCPDGAPAVRLVRRPPRGVLPYVVIAILVNGTIWRCRYDRFGWTTRSSQLYESRLLRIGSPLFHFGLLVVIVGHAIGLVIPKSWTDTAGLSQEAYHIQALVLGAVAGFCTLVGIGLLIYRRRTTGPVFMATTRNDKLMSVVLVAAIVAGFTTTLLGAAGGEEHNYRLTVSPWFRSLFVLQPDVAAISRAGLAFQLHAVIGVAFFALWPFTRLVHAFTAPVQYLFRPYSVYRSRGAGTAARRPRPGWEAVGPEASRRR